MTINAVIEKLQSLVDSGYGDYQLYLISEEVVDYDCTLSERLFDFSDEHKVEVNDNHQYIEIIS